MEFNCKPFLCGMVLGILVPYIPYMTSKRCMDMKDKMMNKMSKAKEAFKEMVLDAKKSTASNMDGVLESINSKIDELSKNLEKMEFSKAKAKSKSSSNGRD